MQKSRHEQKTSKVFLKTVCNLLLGREDLDSVRGG